MSSTSSVPYQLGRLEACGLISRTGHRWRSRRLVSWPRSCRAGSGRVMCPAERPELGGSAIGSAAGVSGPAEVAVHVSVRCVHLRGDVLRRRPGGRCRPGRVAAASDGDDGSGCAQTPP
ncbi:hypothetical protein ACFV8T_30405 [Streptomyces sp. NPDC059832]|uniref:hypothetical protein n=1 Tax=Streptomyces sp. NPDC059832 TaxID=3346966 RepID=UPI00365A5472